MTETQFTNEIIKLAKFFGWKVAHFGNTVKYVKRGSGYKVIPDKNATGFPDLVMARRERLVFAELKLKYNKPPPAQEEWLSALKETGAEVYVWIPEDRGVIDTTLR